MVTGAHGRDEHNIVTLGDVLLIDVITVAVIAGCV